MSTTTIDGITIVTKKVRIKQADIPGLRRSRLALWGESSKKEMDELRMSMRRQPIADDLLILIVNEDDQWRILDGNARVTIAVELGITRMLRFAEVVDASESELLFLGASRNAIRRSIPAGKRAVLMANVMSDNPSIVKAQAAHQADVDLSTMERAIKVANAGLDQYVADGSLPLESAYHLQLPRNKDLLTSLRDGNMTVKKVATAIKKVRDDSRLKANADKAEKLGLTEAQQAEVNKGRVSAETVDHVLGKGREAVNQMKALEKEVERLKDENNRIVIFNGLLTRAMRHADLDVDTILSQCSAVMVDHGEDLLQEFIAEGIMNIPSITRPAAPAADVPAAPTVAEADFTQAMSDWTALRKEAQPEDYGDLSSNDKNKWRRQYEREHPKPVVAAAS